MKTTEVMFVIASVLLMLVPVSPTMLTALIKRFTHKRINGWLVGE